MTVLLAASALDRWAPTYRLWVLIGGGVAVGLALLVLVVAVARAIGMVREMRERNGQ